MKCRRPPALWLGNWHCYGSKTARTRFEPHARMKGRGPPSTNYACNLGTPWFRRPRPAVRTSTAGGNRQPSQLSPDNCSSCREHWAAFTRAPEGTGAKRDREPAHSGKSHESTSVVRGPAPWPPSKSRTWETCRRGRVQQVLTRQHTTHNSGHGPLSTGQDPPGLCNCPGPESGAYTNVHAAVPSNTTQKSTNAHR